LKWQKTEFANGLLLENAALSDALNRQTVFTQPEWDGFDIKDLQRNHYVKSGDSYFKPVAAPKFKSVAIAVMSTKRMIDVGRKSGQSKKSAYFEAAKSWQILIQDAVKSNPQFALLWREHKRDCQRSPFMQALRDGSFLQAVGILVLECARWPWNFGKTQGASKGNHHLICEKPGHPIPRDFRIQIYRFFSAEKKTIKKQLNEKASSKTKTKMDSDDRRDLKEAKNIILLEGL